VRKKGVKLKHMIGPRAIKKEESFSEENCYDKPSKSRITNLEKTLVKGGVTCDSTEIREYASRVVRYRNLRSKGRCLKALKILQKMVDNAIEKMDKDSKWSDNYFEERF